MQHWYTVWSTILFFGSCGTNMNPISASCKNWHSFSAYQHCKVAKVHLLWSINLSINQLPWKAKEVNCIWHYMPNKMLWLLINTNVVVRSRIPWKELKKFKETNFQKAIFSSQKYNLISQTLHKFQKVIHQDLLWKSEKDMSTSM